MRCSCFNVHNVGVLTWLTAGAGKHESNNDVATWQDSTRPSKKYNKKLCSNILHAQYYVVFTKLPRCRDTWAFKAIDDGHSALLNIITGAGARE